MTQKQQIEVDGRELTISNLDKVFFPESGFTKGEVIRFYSEIADAILPHLRDRPLTLKRYPDGIAAEHFYEKNAPKHTPPGCSASPFRGAKAGRTSTMCCAMTARRCSGRRTRATSRSTSSSRGRRR